MSDLSKIRGLLNKLAIAVVREPDSTAGGTSDLLRARIPASLLIAGGPEFVTLGETQRVLYLQCRGALKSLPELQHLPVADVEGDLWWFVCSVAVRPEAYRDQNYRKQQVDNFLSTRVAPLKEYEVLIRIVGLRLPGGSLTIDNVTFFHLTLEEAANRGIPWTVDGLDLSLGGGFLDTTVAQVRVLAGSADRVPGVARQNLAAALNTLRVCIASFSIAHIWDVEMLQRPGEECLVRSINPPEHVLWSEEQGFSPIERDVAGDLLNETAAMIERLRPIIDRTIPRELGAPFSRALHWIGTSITRENQDDKVVDLCTAMEAILTTKGDPRKGEAIALRMMLLAVAIDKGFNHPRFPYDVYERRSSIVHGSDLNLCGDTEYIQLRRLAIDTLLHAVEFIAANPSVTKPSAMIMALETPERLGEALQFLRAFDDRDTTMVTRYCEEKLRKLQNPAISTMQIELSKD